MLKKYCLSFVVFVAVIAIFTGCGSTRFVSQKEKVTLLGNPTTGYMWEYTIKDDSVVTVAENVKNLGRENEIGTPSLFEYSIKSLRPGKTELRFEYRKPWEKNSKSTETYVYGIFVAESGKVKVTEIKEKGN
ncbi:MAG: protease inhibitor I42 family protein [Treponema sp.]|nr:protease inhibitor I42 family protein [Treponema sp.]